MRRADQQIVLLGERRFLALAIDFGSGGEQHRRRSTAAAAASSTSVSCRLVSSTRMGEFTTNSTPTAAAR